jgi:hypothetical protein
LIEFRDAVAAKAKPDLPTVLNGAKMPDMWRIERAGDD